MTGRERLTRLFSGKDIDRIPIWLLFPILPAGYYVNVWELPTYQPIIQRVYETTDAIERRSFDLGFCLNKYPEINYSREQSTQDGYTVDKWLVRYRDIELQRSVMREAHQTIIEPLVKDHSDLKKILSMPYQQPKPEVNWFFRDQETLGNRGLIGVNVSDPIGILHGLCSETGFVMLCYEETQAVKQFLDVMSERTLNSLKYLLDNRVADFYWLNGTEFACPPMFSPRMFDDLEVKYNKQIIDLIHSYGKKTITHCHGTIGEILHGLAETGSDGHHPIESLPMGDCSLTQAREAFGKNVVIIGNIQLGDLWSKTKDEIACIVGQTMKEGKDGAFIVAMTAGPYVPEIPERVARNYLQIIETALKFGAY